MGFGSIRVYPWFNCRCWVQRGREIAEIGRDRDESPRHILTNEIRGYMGAKADHALALNSRGRQ
ncbi:MAG: hypothetical protein EXS41_03975 [Opitutaceae bacterium]|nr:hypothetical protein [Opitutaceae bacterium]